MASFCGALRNDRHVQIDTAKKLRWYDREDLSQLISITTREKQQLQDTLIALRQVPQSPLKLRSSRRTYLKRLH